MATIEKAAKGTVSVEVFEGRLRLRWREGGKRYTLSLGLPDSKVNRTVAQQKANQIQLDIISGNFDSTLKKYKPTMLVQLAQIGVVALFKKFYEYRAKSLSGKTLEKYKATLGYLSRFFEDQRVSTINLAKAENFAEWLKAQDLSPGQCKRRLQELKACWDWAIKQELAEDNPWTDLPGRIKVPPKQMPKPFSKEEVQAIIKGFRTDRHYHHYADYVEFLFGTGCRTGEAIGLRWKHLTDDCSTAWIGESISRGVHKATKTNKARTVTLTSKLQEMLLARRPSKGS
jgi:integrase